MAATCPWTFHAPPDGATVPANLLALPIGHSGSPFIWPLLPELRDAHGLPVPVTVVQSGWADWNAQLVTPLALLQPGLGYELRFQDHCKGWGGEGVAEYTRKVPFQAGPAMSAPKQLGVLQILDLGVGPMEVPDGASCFAKFAGHAVRWRLLPSPEFAPWRPLARVVVSVDGKPWARSHYGYWNADGSFAPLPPALLQREPDVVYTPCDAALLACPPCHSGVGLGPHTLTVQLHVAGMAQDPSPVTAKFTLACPQSQLPGGDAASGDTAAEDEPEPEEPADSTGSLPAPLPKPPAQDSSCRANGGRAGGVSWSSFLLASVAVTLVVVIRRGRSWHKSLR